ncbi:integrin beta-3-like isoform X2 [Ostrea edulis]|uniref:integrin beta-3-like isoform X2 n=1 Tax=Ostrea edulis TaxID=37623 RepID=UPI0024AEB5F5|nr:integrin beta-3-like isoform X2 [Ostrea edulis]
MFFKTVHIGVLLIFYSSVQSQSCSGKRCGDCLIFEGCAWCKDPEYSFNRCATESQTTSNGCRQVVRRGSHGVQIIRNNEFSDGGPGMEPVQIKPQRVKIKLVPNILFRNLQVFYKIARNFPLDLYFLNDPSYTMKALIARLNALAYDIADEIAKLTTDFRFGLGTAMDKVIWPFTRVDPLFLAYPCGSPSIQCDKPYSFLHRQSLTSNITKFKSTLLAVENAVNDVNTTANQDITEGLFDGLMQVMVCGDRIGWRKKARRMVIYATDINFHQSGDGRFANILEPNDGLCHLNDAGKYTMAEIQDYPSVGQIVQKARENNINIIFVIGGNDNTAVRSLFYDSLAAILPGGINNASALSPDASDILSIVGNNYRRLRETVKIVTSGVPEELIMGLYSNCKTGGRTLDRTDTCTGLTIDKWANFTVYLVSNLTVCPEKRDFIFTLFPEGLEERVEIEVEHVCECKCQLEPEAEPNSTKCNNQGTYECGVCHCNVGWSGDTCECDERGTEAEACGTDSGICNNAGNCTCGRCECFDGYSGDRCECNDLDCPSDNGLLCGGPDHGQCSCGASSSVLCICKGPDHGQCSCGACVCNSTYTGEVCDCSTSADSCRDNNGTICTGNGNCECGKCRCEVGFRGDVCDRCQHCPGICENNNNCVECVGFNQGPFNTTDCSEKCQNVEVVSLLQDSAGENETSTSCTLQDNSGCLIEFNVYDSDGGQYVKVKSWKRCPPGPADPLTVGLGLSGAIFLVGLLLLLIWKLLTMLYDKMEYSKFESEIQNPAWEKSENPIYKECVTTVQNPLHDAECIKDPEGLVNNEEEKILKDA